MTFEEYENAVDRSKILIYEHLQLDGNHAKEIAEIWGITEKIVNYAVENFSWDVVGEYETILAYIIGYHDAKYGPHEKEDYDEFCYFCGDVISTSSGCVINQVSFEDEAVFDRIPFLSSKNENDRCEICNAQSGQCHHEGCPKEICPRCKKVGGCNSWCGVMRTRMR